MSRDRDGDLDRGRFDRELARSQEREPRAREGRGPKFVGRTPCPHCFYPNRVTAQGASSSGKALFEVGTHSPGAGIRRPGKPICKGSNARVERQADGTWKAIK